MSVLCVQSLSTAPGVLCWQALWSLDTGWCDVSFSQNSVNVSCYENIYPVNNQANHFLGERGDTFQLGLAWRNHWLQMRSHPQPCQSTRTEINFFYFLCLIVWILLFLKAPVNWKLFSCIKLYLCETPPAVLHSPLRSPAQGGQGTAGQSRRGHGDALRTGAPQFWTCSPGEGLGETSEPLPCLKGFQES